MRLPPYFDPTGETEPNNRLYTVLALKPPQPLTRWLPSLFKHTPNTGYMLSDIDCLDTKSIKLKSSSFPPHMRCTHLDQNATCTAGCYFLEKGGAGWRCQREDCKGHLYSATVLKDKTGTACFGKKGNRIVCIVR
jgi:hypothetical protein